MEGIFREFENENALRSYPFASGCVQPDDAGRIPESLFVDAALYPVNPSGPLYLSGISENGVFSISDSAGVIMDGVRSGASVEFYDTSSFRRHVGTMIASSAEALEEFAGRGEEIEFDESETSFASSCVFPVVVDGVTSLSVGGSEADDGTISFSNGPSDDIRVSGSKASDGRDTLRFDILPRPGSEEPSIRRIICVVDGQTPFRIDRSQFNYNTVILSLFGVDKESVCSAAHRENQYEMSDTCECDKPPLPSKEQLPDAYQLIEVFIPPDESGDEGGLPDGSENAFYLAVPNMQGYRNPISITLVDGEMVPDTDGPDAIVEGGDARIEDDDLVDSVSSKGVVLQVPGLSGGDA